MSGMNTGLEGTRRKYDTGVFETHRLDNGVTIWLQKPPVLTDEEGIVIAFLPQVGSQQDPAEAHGLAHFLEHLPFRGTAKKPSKEALVFPIEEAGGSVNAQTSRDFLRYIVEMPLDNFALAAETALELVARPLITDENLEKERGAIAQEYRNNHSGGRNLGSAYFYRSLFGEHSLAHSPIGSPESIEKMTRENLEIFYRDHFHAGNVHVVCGGSFAERDDVLEVIGQLFGELPLGTPITLRDSELLPFDKKGREAIVDPRCDVASLTIAYPLRPVLSDVKGDALEFLMQLLSTGMRSPLFLELREKTGLIYSLEWALQCYRDIWVTGLNIPVRPQHFGVVEETWRRVLECLDADFVVKCQKTRQLSRRTRFSRPLSRCYGLVQNLSSHGRNFTNWEIETTEDAVTVEDVLGWRDYFLNAPPFIFEIRVS